jgi:hypothetical protein
VPNILKISILEDQGKDISSRADAAQLRERVMEFGSLDPDNVVELDFAGVRTVSESSADELIAIMAYVTGPGWFSQHVKLINLLPHHREVIVNTCILRAQREAEKLKKSIEGILDAHTSRS